jgi:hypothetical protein
VIVNVKNQIYHICRVYRSDVAICNRNDPDLVQAFLKKWWVESDFKAPNLHFHYGSKVPAVTITFEKWEDAK